MCEGDERVVRPRGGRCIVVMSGGICGRVLPRVVTDGAALLRSRRWAGGRAVRLEDVGEGLGGDGQVELGDEPGAGSGRAAELVERRGGLV